MVASLTAATAATGAENVNMIGGQSQNEGLSIVPAPQEVKVDGDLADWDFSGRIWIFAEKSIRSRFSVELAAMWDSDALYVALRWKDPTPMHSMVDPRFNPSDGWKSDAVQLRLKTADRTSWLTAWYYTPRKQPVVHYAIWKDPTNSRGGQEETLYTAVGSNKLGSGVEMAYQKAETGDGYVQEMRIPWSLLYADAPRPEPGQSFRMGVEVLWGDPTGKTWPIHRYADNVQPGKTRREFFWANYGIWGDATLVKSGDLEPRKYVSGETRLRGTIPIRLELPRDTARFSLAIDDADGRRIRNMGGLDPADYTVKTTDDHLVVEVPWDALGDPHRQDGGDGAVSETVEPGRYRVFGVRHSGLGAEYEMCYYNPGTPPWHTADGTGGWGADHARPLRVARSGDGVIVSWKFAEGGDGIIGIGGDGKKQWGEKRGGKYLAADANYVYAVPSSWHIEREILIRLDARTGGYRPFVKDGQPRPFELPTSEIFGPDDAGDIVAIAAGPDGLAVSRSNGWIVLLDLESAEPIRRLKVESPGDLAFASDGRLFALLGGKVHRVDLQKKTVAPCATPGVGQAVALDVDAEDNVLVLDAGPDCQVKAFDGDGKMVYTCGKRGGRPIRGTFEPQAMMRMSDIAVDADGRIWAAENWDYPRRVSVWNREGKLVRDYIGNTGYAATGCFLHETDPTLAYVGPVEIKLNRDANTWQVTQVLWVPDEDKGERFPIDPGSHAQPQRFASNASGQRREYLYRIPYRSFEGHVIYMEREDGWKPVAAVTTVSQISGGVDAYKGVTAMPTGEWAGLDPYDGVYWTDRNGDGIAQRNEATIVPTNEPAGAVGEKGRNGLKLGSGWGGQIDTGTLTFYSSGLTAYEPAGFTDDGAPIYTPQSTRRFGPDEWGDVVPLPETDRLIFLSRTGQPGPTPGVQAVNAQTGKVLWRYPNLYPHVHGSHRATMPKPGLLIGPLKITGVAHANDDIGHVVHLRGNLGQDFLLTEDGVFVDSMFQDGRLPGLQLPPTEKELRGMPMEAFSGGGEPFNGWFGCQADGRVRLVSGIPRQAAMIMRVTGLETIRRLPAQTLTLTDADLAKARQANEKQGGEASRPSYVIARTVRPMQIDAKGDEWADIDAVEAALTGSPQKAKIKLAYDAKHLYALYRVQDVTPWANAGKGYTRLFKTGDAVDLQLSATGNASKPKAGDVRLLIAPGKRGPVAVIMQPVAPDADASAAHTYTSPVRPRRFDRVSVVDDVQVKVARRPDGYTVEYAVPWRVLGIEPGPGMKLTGDVGFTGSDASGQTTVSRTYWANARTNLVNDEPAEAWLYPDQWGRMQLGD
jgi:sugar lactone lactonase YvrE